MWYKWFIVVGVTQENIHIYNNISAFTWASFTTFSLHIQFGWGSFLFYLYPLEHKGQFKVNYIFKTKGWSRINLHNTKPYVTVERKPVVLCWCSAQGVITSSSFQKFKEGKQMLKPHCRGFTFKALLFWFMVVFRSGFRTSKVKKASLEIHITK